MVAFKCKPCLVENCYPLHRVPDTRNGNKTKLPNSRCVCLFICKCMLLYRKEKLLSGSHIDMKKYT